MFEGKQENVPPRSVKDRLGVPNVVPPNSNKVLNLVQPKADNTVPEETENGTEKLPNSFTKNNVVKKEPSKAQAVAAIKKGQEMLAVKEKLKKNQEEQRKEALKLTQNLRKRKQELLEKQLASQKVLIKKLEESNFFNFFLCVVCLIIITILAPAGPQRDKLKETIKKTQDAIEEISKEMQAQTALPAKIMRKSKEETQKEMLDAELDLITKQQEGGDTSEIQKKLLELRAKIGMTRGRGRARGRFNPIVSRQLLTKNNLVDNNSGEFLSFLFGKFGVLHMIFFVLVFVNFLEEICTFA